MLLFMSGVELNPGPVPTFGQSLVSSDLAFSTCHQHEGDEKSKAKAEQSDNCPSNNIPSKTSEAPSILHDHGSYTTTESPEQR